MSTSLHLPTLFISHGAPLFALEPGRAGALLAELGQTMPRPRAILVMSPHWMTSGAAPVIGLSTQPETIHDFGGFPAPLYALRYPAAGSRELALKVAQLLEVAGMSSSFDERRGLDHGAWVPLMHLYPDADVPVVPISLPASLSPEGLWKLGEALSSLADEGVLIVGSGGLTHNLYEVRMNADQEAPYARAFVQWAREAVRVRDRAALTGFATAAPETRRAHPTAEHFLPLLFAAGAGQHRPDVTVLEGGTLYHVLSMESYVFTEASTTPVAA